MRSIHKTLIGTLTLAAIATTQAAPPHYARWKTFDTTTGLPSNKVLCVCATATDVWVGTDRGLGRYGDGRWKIYTHKDGLAHDGVMCITEDRRTGDLWIGTLGGLSRYSAGRFETFTQFNSGLPNNVVYGVAAHRGEIWAATAAGAGRYEIAQDRWHLYDQSNTPMHEIWCYSAAAAGDKIYLGVWGGGLLEYSLTRRRWKDYRDPDGEMELDLFRNDGLVHDIVTGVTRDDADRIWVGTYFGLSSYDGRNWRNFMEHDSPLVSNFVNYVYAHGTFAWIATDNGLCATDRANWWTYQRDPETGKGLVTWAPAKGPAEHLVTETAFPHNFILGISFRGDEIWLATERGVARGLLATPRTARVDAPPAQARAQRTGR